MNEPRPDHILQVGLGFWASKTLLSAVEMELFTELAKHPLPQTELEGRLGLHPRSARDFPFGPQKVGGYAAGAETSEDRERGDAVSKDDRGHARALGQGSRKRPRV